MRKTSSSQKPVLLIDRFDTPIGEMILVADAQGCLRAIDWTDKEDRFQDLLERHCGVAPTLRETRDPLGMSTAMRRYFDGDISVIDDLPVVTDGTAFQRRVWDGLREIPAGETTSYGALAKRLGHATAVRAVGLANGQNPVSVVVPCHRVIGANGALTGYGGGLDRKRWLLAHEQTHRREVPRELG